MGNRSTTFRTIRIVVWSSVCLLFVAGWFVMIRMPGRSFRGPAPPLTPDEMTLRDELVAHVQKLAGEIGERNLSHYPRLAEAAHYIETELTGAGYQVRRDSYEIEGKTCSNLEVELGGVSRDIVLIGAHYDSVFGSPGANDNGSGVAALLALARRFAGTHNSKTLRFVAFVNEEPFYFQSAEMGSFVYAGRCRERGDEISAMISLETIGYFSSQAGLTAISGARARTALSTHGQLYWICRERSLPALFCALRSANFAGRPESHPKARPCPRWFRESAGPINGHSGSTVTLESWSPIQRPSAIRIITRPAIRRTNWITIQ